MGSSSHTARLNVVRDAVVQHFGTNLVSILLYGSSKDSPEFWDVDILIVLDKKSQMLSDARALKSIWKDFPVPLDLQLVYQEEIEAPDYFSLGASGSFFLPILQKAKVLYGVNPFLALAPSEEATIQSLLHRIQGYVFKARQEGMGMQRFDKDQNPSYHKKHVQRAILDVALLYEEVQDLPQAYGVYKKHFPLALTAEQWKAITTSRANEKDIEFYLPLYETVYQSALEARRLFLPGTRVKPKRGELQGLVFEYLIPEEYTKAIVVIDGLPRQPELSDFLNLLSSWGYAVFYPRLRGTWESQGAFLDHNPADDIKELIEAINDNTLVLDNATVPNPEVTVIGSSFGGLIALYSSGLPHVKQVIALSPVYAMSQIPGIETLGEYVRTYFSDAYRYTNDDWNKLIHNHLISFDRLVGSHDFDPSCCTVLGGEFDEQIKVNDLKERAEKCMIEFMQLPTPHISFHKNIRVVRPLLYKLLRK